MDFRISKETMVLVLAIRYIHDRKYKFETFFIEIFTKFMELEKKIEKNQENFSSDKRSTLITD